MNQGVKSTAPSFFPLVLGSPVPGSDPSRPLQKLCACSWDVARTEAQTIPPCSVHLSFRKALWRLRIWVKG
jgi:hypothetical protein